MIHWLIILWFRIILAHIWTQMAHNGSEVPGVLRWLWMSHMAHPLVAPYGSWALKNGWAKFNALWARLSQWLIIAIKWMSHLTFWWAISLAFWCHQSINLEIKIWQTIKLWLDLWHHWWCLCLWSHWWYLYLIYIWHHDLHDVMICKPHLDKGLKNISFVTPSIFGW